MPSTMTMLEERPVFGFLEGDILLQALQSGLCNVDDLGFPLFEPDEAELDSIHTCQGILTDTLLHAAAVGKLLLELKGALCLLDFFDQSAVSRRLYEGTDEERGNGG